DHQIGLGSRAFAQAVGLIGLLQVQAGDVGLGVHGDALDVQLAQGAQDAAGNGAAVGDQEFVEHSRCPRSGGPSRGIRSAPRSSGVEILCSGRDPVGGLVG